MPPLARRRPPWWLTAILLLYLLTQSVNTWQEVFGPGSVGILPGEEHFTLLEVTPGLPMDLAGVRSGDTIEVVDGIPIAGWADWFVARANFRRDVDTPIRLRRGHEVLNRSFVVRTTNWEQWSLLTFAFQAARWTALALAVTLAFWRPHQPCAWLLAWMLCAIAVTEGNPSAGWLATLRDLPTALAFAVGGATASWLFIPALWLAFCHAFPHQIPWRLPAVFLTVSYVLSFGSFAGLSLAAMIRRAEGLAMPTPFGDVGATHVVAGLFSVTPQLFLNPWPWYTPERQSILLGGWLVTSGILLVLGVRTLAARYRSSQAEPERRRVAAVLASVGGMGLVGVHNVLMRNWETVAGERPVWLNDWFVIAEALVFALAATFLTYAVAASPGRGAKVE